MGWHTLEPASKLREGEVKTFEMGGRQVAIGRTTEGYFAMEDRCPHAGGSLGEGTLEGENVLCPIHGYAYHVRTGEGLDDGNEVRVYPVALEGDLLRVNLHDEE